MADVKKIWFLLKQRFDYKFYPDLYWYFALLILADQNLLTNSKMCRVESHVIFEQRSYGNGIHTRNRVDGFALLHFVLIEQTVHFASRHLRCSHAHSGNFQHLPSLQTTRNQRIVVNNGSRRNFVCLCQRIERLTRLDGMHIVAITLNANDTLRAAHIG